jgi:thiol-disulfide isomerase/thioredoxin
MLMSLCALDFEEYINKSEYSAVVFFAENCPPCRMFCDVFERFSKENTDVNFFKVNVDNEEELASKYGVQIMPMVVFFKNGD